MTRAEVWRLLGAPQDQIGSANEPRSVEEHGVSWNEKWVHRDARDRIERVVLWNRYDLVGVFRVGEDGSWHPEPLPEG